MKCAFCGCPIELCANSCYPIILDEKAVCCNDCNSNYVIPARMIAWLQMRKEREQEQALHQEENCIE